MKKSMKIIISCILGVTFEFYDFIIYGIFSMDIAKALFPSRSDNYSLVYSLFVFSLAFLTRPLGALIFGYIGDTYGRKKSLLLSMSCMFIATTIIGLIPNYSHIGIYATFILIVCRLAQGISMGGEIVGSALSILEQRFGLNKGLCSGLILSGASLGALIAFVLSYLLRRVIPEDQVWRYCFIVGIGMSLIILYLRNSLKDDYQLKKSPYRFPFYQSIMLYKKSHLVLFFINSLAGINAYSFSVLIKIILLEFVEITENEILEYLIFSHITFIFFSPFMGRLSDKVGNINLTMTSHLLMIALLYPIYYFLLSGDFSEIVLSLSFFGLLIAMHNANIYAIGCTLFPYQIRFSAISMNYALSMSLFGGTMPAFSIYLIKKFSTAYAAVYYHIAFTAITLGITYLCKAYFSRDLFRHSYHQNPASSITSG